ncbi:hypothetical protein [Candidatus Liberibacter americanus]|uniref:hypothetical protein n=1 Tax=Candidatus Liberibacter americanus TaxID=309868 RepID=UPI001182FC06|nr:hypothetical protein [Candidatus Liberibacter americanus]
MLSSSTLLSGCNFLGISFPTGKADVNSADEIKGQENSNKSGEGAGTKAQGETEKAAKVEEKSTNDNRNDQSSAGQKDPKEIMDLINQVQAQIQINSQKLKEKIKEHQIEN